MLRESSVLCFPRDDPYLRREGEATERGAASSSLRDDGAPPRFHVAIGRSVPLLRHLYIGSAYHSSPRDAKHYGNPQPRAGSSTIYQGLRIYSEALFSARRT